MSLPGIIGFPCFAAAEGMMAVATPSNVSKFKRFSGTVTSPTTTVTVTGGTPSFSYAWAGTGGSISATAPTAAATQFEASLGSSEDATDTFTCTVTDANGVVTTATCGVTLGTVD